MSISKNNVDIFCCAETWCQEGRIEQLSWYERLGTDFVTIIVPATKSKEMGRYKGGFLICVNRNTFKISKHHNSTSSVLLELQDKQTLKYLKVTFVYFSPLEIENEYENFVNSAQFNVSDLIIGDFNARIGQKNNCDIVRNSKESLTNKRGRYLLKKSSNFRILNGTTYPDNIGDFTFISKRGCSVVDLCLVKNEIITQSYEFQVKHTHLSHHAQIFVTSGKIDKQQSTGSANTNQQIPKIKWNEKQRIKFLQQLHQTEANMTYGSLHSAIYKCAKLAGMQTERKEHTNKAGPIWMDSELRKAKSKYRYCVSKFRRCLPNDDINIFLYCKTEMLKAKCQYLKLTQEKKLFFIDVQKNKNSEKWEAVLVGIRYI